MFRMIIKALGENNSEMKYYYDVVEFNENGTFKRLPVKVSDTSVRLKDDNGRWEVVEYGEPRRISEPEFENLYKDWEETRRKSGYAPLDLASFK